MDLYNVYHSIPCYIKKNYGWHSKVFRIVVNSSCIRVMFPFCFMFNIMNINLFCLEKKNLFCFILFYYYILLSCFILFYYFILNPKVWRCYKQIFLFVFWACWLLTFLCLGCGWNCKGITNWSIFFARSGRNI